MFSRMSRRATRWSPILLAVAGGALGAAPEAHAGAKVCNSAICESIAVKAGATRPHGAMRLDLSYRATRRRTDATPRNARIVLPRGTRLNGTSRPICDGDCVDYPDFFADVQFPYEVGSVRRLEIFTRGSETIRPVTARLSNSVRVVNGAKVPQLMLSGLMEYAGFIGQYFFYFAETSPGVLTQQTVRNYSEGLGIAALDMTIPAFTSERGVPYLRAPGRCAGTPWTWSWTLLGATPLTARTSSACRLNLPRPPRRPKGLTQAQMQSLAVNLGRALLADHTMEAEIFAVEGCGRLRTSRYEGKCLIRFLRGRDNNCSFGIRIKLDRYAQRARATRAGKDCSDT